MSSTLRMSDILDRNVSVVEDLFKAREPLPLPAVYFIQPTPASILRLLEDYASPATAPYPAVHVFFSSRVRACCTWGLRTQGARLRGGVRRSLGVRAVRGCTAACVGPRALHACSACTTRRVRACMALHSRPPLQSSL